jgi:hypothetical protein
MKALALSLLIVPALANAVEFQTAVILSAEGEPVRMEAPGFACPTWADWDGDGKKDLLVGQFNDGNIQWFKNLGGEGIPKLAKGEWIKSGEKRAAVPGVW